MAKRIGVLTSGGDCSGLNAAIRAITLRSIQHYGWEVFGILKGTSGFMRDPMQYIKLDLNNCDYNMLRSAGTILGSTNKDNPFFFPNESGNKEDRSDEVVKGYHKLNLDALIAIGGDGSMKINSRLSKKGDINIVGIPKTIDNDLAHTDLSIGYSTAVTVATEALDRLHPTAASHQRVMILEVMGRDAGHIALSAGIAGGADVILIPEAAYSIDAICSHIQKINSSGRNFALIIVAEAVKNSAGESLLHGVSYNDRPRYGGIAQYLCSEIETRLKIDTRCTVLGHVQRGGQPNAEDRILATALGVKAVDMVANSEFNKMAVWHNNKVESVPIEHTIEVYNRVDLNGVLASTAKSMGIYLGEV